ncbi:PREDICTED: phenoloxidase 2-like [Nicrophorus vespilloides]|uniref:Phenoloxidase 2-like n=1 Tax=Nicrophorus vespilloides TaxID=110193 RepID=A0ABM1NK14_NICVS|nr:PREDICTED: phenoloxidase 2-like [Nicrophorus vespilloides]
MATDKKQNLLYLFHRPQEPSFVPKGENAVAFDVPAKFLPERYKQLGTQLESRFGEATSQKISLVDIKEPNLTNIMRLGRHENFSLFLPKHQNIAAELINIFMAAKNVDELQSLGVYCRDRVNPYLFVYAFSVALLHRPDTQGVNPPNFAQTFPDKYFQSGIFAKAREETSVVPTGSRMPIEIPRDYSASDLDEEHRVAYWREDIGVNLHHWHWHLVYPTNAAMSIVNKDRRGELFYYMHNQLIARYNVERLCNKLKRVVKYSEFEKPIKEAYFPKLDSLVSSRTYPARVSNQVLQNLNRQQDEIVMDVAALERWRDRIFGAIHSGFVMDRDGKQIPLTENEGIDVLGNVLESTILSPNPDFYGNFHGMGHVFLSYIHDPDHRHLENFGVMGDFATTMRDPMFYRWHSYIDDIFLEYKATLPRYNVGQLNYTGITVDSVSMQGEGSKPNEINTFWQQSDVDLSRGMDFQPRGSVFVRLTHLQHQPYTYNITVNNASGSPKMGMCRIFLAPKFDERGNPWLFRDQKSMFIELDKFKVNLKAGKNTITRMSTQSSVTIPFERTFSDLDTNRPTGGDALAQFNFCNCGWPQHLLLPKGTPEGYVCQLFVMVSNYDLDKIDQDETGVCNDAASFCGLKDKKYPDRRSMGYPFDRMPRNGVDNLQQFLTPNMRVQDCIIRHNNRTIRRKN